MLEVITKSATLWEEKEVRAERERKRERQRV